VRGGGLAQVVQDGAGLDAGGAGVRVDPGDPVHVPGEVQDDPGAGGLPRDGRPATARHHRHPVLAAHRQCRGHVLRVHRGDHAQGNTAVVGGIHRHEGACPRVALDLAAYRRTQRTFHVPRQTSRHVPSLP
jgi:hypothetical protein